MTEPGSMIVGIIIVTGFFIGTLTHHLRLTSIVGYIAAGILLGPVFHIVELSPYATREITSFTLALVAFIIGGTFTLDFLKEAGKTVWIIILGESFGAFFLVLLGAYILKHDLIIALIFASLAPASAPAGTIAALHDAKAKGPLSKMATAVVGLDDASSIILFVISFAVIKALLGGTTSVSSVILKPLTEIGGAAVLGVVIGTGLAFFTKRKRGREDVFMMSLVSILICATLAQTFGFSLILACMFLGASFVNQAPQGGSLYFERIENFLPPIYILFFTTAGLELKPHLLITMGSLGIVYVICRSFGLIGGAYAGSVIGKADPIIQKYLGFTILSQAGVAVGLASFVATRLSSYGSIGTELGAMAITIITATTVVFEIIGPLGVRYAVTRAGEAGKA